MGALIAYFSRRGENYVSGKLKELSVGNTEVAAGMLQQLTGADLFQLEPVHEYPKSYNACIDEAQADQRRDARPELKRYPESLDGYDTIYLGYPNYWGTMPMPVFTFLEHFDFSGKNHSPLLHPRGQRLGAQRTRYQTAVSGSVRQTRACPPWGKCEKRPASPPSMAGKLINRRKRTWNLPP